MAQYYPQQQGYAPQGSAQNLQFFPSSYGSVSGHTTPAQASYGNSAGFGGAPNPSAQAYPVGGGYGGFGSPATGVSGRMGEQGGLRTGWLAAFGTEGYDGEPPLLEELGVNFEHIRTKVSCCICGGLFLCSNWPLCILHDHEGFISHTCNTVTIYRITRDLHHTNEPPLFSRPSQS